MTAAIKMHVKKGDTVLVLSGNCLLYTSDAADD